MQRRFRATSDNTNIQILCAKLKIYNNLKCEKWPGIPDGECTSQRKDSVCADNVRRGEQGNWE